MKQFDSFRLDASNQCLWRDGEQIALPPKPFAVLRYLVENPGRLISHDELLDKLWPETFVQPQVLRTYVLDLRKALGDDAGQPRFIQTMPKRGYRFVAPVRENGCDESDAGGSAMRPDHSGKVLVGRDGELTRLRRLVEQVANGQRRVLFVCGEAGIGKTALLDLFCRQIESAGSATIARGQCVQSIGAREDYYPVMEALGALCASPNGEDACRILKRRAPAWMAVRSDSDHAVEASAKIANLQPERTLGDLCAALEEVSAQNPLILIFEDLEWADDCTLNLISALARRRAVAKLMVVVTGRPMKGASEHPLKVLKQDLLMRKLVAELHLEPLRKAAVRELLRKELQQEALPPGLEGFVTQRAEGNPLFVIAILEHLISECLLQRKAGNNSEAWALQPGFESREAEVPGELAQMVELEIERMGPEDQSLLEAGSLMNIAFPGWAVAAALEKDVNAIEEGCDALARRFHFVERGGQDELPDGTSSAFYVFAHGLYREVLYHRQPAARRRKRHVRIAERLEQLFAGREADVAREIAQHYEAGAEWLRAANGLRKAAAQAQRKQDFGDAADLLQQAMRLLRDRNGKDLQAALHQIEHESEALRAAMARGTEMRQELQQKA
jgi:predicted ATPase